MSTKRARSVVSAVLLAAAAFLGAAAPARAALYTGSWDPLYGGIFPALDWGATAVFDVPQACLAIGNGTNIPISGPCASFDVVSAEVHFESDGEILQSYPLKPNVIVNGIDLAGGKLVGIDTGFFDYFVSDLSLAGSGKYSFSLLLFGGNRAQLIYAWPQATSPICAFTPIANTECGISANAAIGVFAPIPEPETFALLAAGLAAVGVAVRRRRR